MSTALKSVGDIGSPCFTPLPTGMRLFIPLPFWYEPNYLCTILTGIQSTAAVPQVENSPHNRGERLSQMLSIHQQKSDLTFSILASFSWWGISPAICYRRDHLRNETLLARRQWQGNHSFVENSVEQSTDEGLTVIGLKSLGLVTPIDLGIQVTIPILDCKVDVPDPFYVLFL